MMIPPKVKQNPLKVMYIMCLNGYYFTQQDLITKHAMFLLPSNSSHLTLLVVSINSALKMMLEQVCRKYLIKLRKSLIFSFLHFR